MYAMTEQPQLGSSTERALALAMEESRRMNHNWIGTEHLLLGLLGDYFGSASRVLRRLGVDFAEARVAVEAVVGKGEKPVTGEVGLAPRARQALTLAAESAAAEGSAVLEPHHLLLALVNARDPDGQPRSVAAGLLETFGVTPEQIQAEIPGVLAEEPEIENHPFHLALEGKIEEARRLAAEWQGRPQSRRYSLVMPEDLFAEVERLAQRQNTTVVDLLRRFTRLGLLAMQVQDRPDAALILREGGVERQLLLL
jgi:ATP-dependent Clp protease ATP-binding subunit ClpA